MTPSEIRRLAVEVLGWKETGKEDHTRPRHFMSRDFPGRRIDDFESKGPHHRLDAPDGSGSVFLCGCRDTAELPDPFSNLSDAFMVAEKIGGLLLEHDEVTKNWVATFPGESVSKCRIDLLQHGKTPAEAISRAALAWLSAREGK